MNYEEVPGDTQIDSQDSVQDQPLQEQGDFSPSQTDNTASNTDFTEVVLKLDDLHSEMLVQTQLQTDQNGLLLFLIGLIAGITFMISALKGWYRA